MSNNSVEETKKLNEQSRANKGAGSNAPSNAGMTSSTSGSPIEETKKFNEQSRANKGASSNAPSNAGMTSSTGGASNASGMSNVSNAYGMSSSTNDSALEETKKLNKQSVANKGKSK